MEIYNSFSYFVQNDYSDVHQNHDNYYSHESYDQTYGDTDHVSEFIDEDNNSNTYDKKYVRNFEVCFQNNFSYRLTK